MTPGNCPAPSDLANDLTEVCSYAESKALYDKTVFCWKIENYMQLSHNGQDCVHSPEMYTKPDAHKWELRIRPRQPVDSAFNWLSVHVYLKKMSGKTTQSTREKGIPVRFTVSIMDAEGNDLKCAKLSELSYFHEMNGFGYENLISVRDLLSTDSNHPDYLPDGHLRIRCMLLVDYEIVHRLVCLNKPKPEARAHCSRGSNRVAGDFLMLWLNQTLSDLELQVGPQKFQVHKAVLVARCKKFKEFLSPPEMKSTSHLEINDFHPEVVLPMLEYLYCGEVQNEVGISSKPDQAFGIAAKFDLPEFASICDDIIAKRISIEGAMDAFAAAVKYNRTCLIDRLTMFINWNKATIITTEGFNRVQKTAPIAFKQLYLAYF